jgi:uncharacterized protein YjbI with pentapeptide repeats
LDLINQTPFHFAPLVGRLNYPGHSLTLIVKGTFDLKSGQTATQAEEQLYPTGDEFYPGDDEMEGSPRYETDFACFKPRADLLLVGKCYGPGGNPVPACRVNFQVASWSKSLAIFGDRYWKGTLGINSGSDPDPFTEMALRYENSFGGPEYEKNPVGKGFRKETTETGEEVWPLPNIEDSQNMIDSPRSRPEPAGFGPLGRMWQHRFSRMGTYGDRWLEERWPWFPEDFDWGHFNTAPEDMQVDGYLRGDEALHFENLRPDHPQYASRLPGLRVRFFINKLPGQEGEETRFEEVPMNLDTLWVDMETEKLVLVWRGWTEVLSEDYEEVKHFFIMSEAVDQEPQSVDQCHQLFLGALAEEEREWEMAPEEPEAPEEPPAPEVKEPAEPIEKPEEPVPEDVGLDPKSQAMLKDLEKDMAESEASLKAEFKKLGLDPDEFMKEMPPVPPMPSPDASAPPTELSLQDLEKEIVKGEAELKEFTKKMGIDLDKPMEMPSKALPEEELSPKDIVQRLKEAGIDDPELEKHLLEMEKESEAAERELEALLKEEEEEAAVEPEKEEPLAEEGLEREVGVEEEYTRERVFEEYEQSKGLAGKDLSGLDLSGLNLVQIGLAGAVLEKVNFSGTNLSGAELSDANLTDAAMSEANLTDAKMEGSDLSVADLTNVKLAGAVLSGANLTSAKLRGADVSGADLTGANLTEANLSKADLGRALLKDADATEADLTEAKLTGALLTDATFERAKLAGAVLDDVEATSATFTEADLSGVSSRNADLSSADLSGCLLDGADFQGANLSKANVYGAMGTHVNFSEANLTKLRASEGCDFSEGRFVKARGLESMWQDANLTGADFSFSQMEGADFTGASLERANFYAANMKFSRFRKTNLREAALVQMNLFEGSLEKADLTAADLRDSNFYGSEFLEAVVEDALLDGANLKMTKVAKWNE